MIEINDLFIGVNKDNINIDSEKTDLILKKQNGKCKCCGFSAKGGYFPYKSGKNVFILCSICYYTLSLNNIPLEEKGSIIMFPHLTQKEINAIVRAYWYVESLDSDFDEEKDSISILMTLLEQQEIIANKYYSNGISKPDLLIQLFYELKKEEYLNRRVGAVGLRWLPPKELFESDIKVWVEDDFSKIPIDSWRELIIKIKTNIKEHNNEKD